MAEGVKKKRSFNDSYSIASDDIDEVFCDPCTNEGKRIAVEGYCQICKEFLCDTCLRVHRKQKITRAHNILDKKQMLKMKRPISNRDICVEVCKTHHSEIIRFYCKAHDEPGCGDCMTLKHTSCKKDRVQDISDGFVKTKEFKDIRKTPLQFHQELEEMEDVLDSNLKNMDTTFRNIQLKITSIRKQMNEYLDQIQEKLTLEAVEMKKEDETELQTLHAENQAMKAEIEVMLKTINVSNVNVNSLFVITKQAKQRMVTMEKEIYKMKQLQQQQQYELRFSSEIEKVLFAKTPLGTLSRKSPQSTPRKPAIHVTARYIRSINVKCEIDKDICLIIDCTLLRPDKMVVIDKYNKNVKLIDISNNKVISRYNVSSEPNKVTALSTNMIAVTLPGESKIQLLDVNTAFTLQREINVNSACYGIAYKDEKFAVSYTNPSRVEILDINGKILHTIQPKQGEEYSLHLPYFITFGHVNGTVIVSDSKTNKVSVVTFRGQILRSYTHDRLKDPQGMVITEGGVLFVCSWWGGCIHVVSPDFKTSKIINNDDNVVRPASITYCDIKHRLYISSTYIRGGDHSNKVHVYHLSE